MKNNNAMKTILASRVKEEINDWLSTGKRLIPILFFLLFGVGNVWGYVNGSAYLYFTPNGKWSYTKYYFAAIKEHDSWETKVYEMTSISNTKLYYLSTTEWNDADYITVIGNNSSFSGGYWGYSSLSSYAAMCGEKCSWGLNYQNSYLFYPSANTKGKSINATWLGNNYSDLNHSQTVEKYTSTNNGSSYSQSSTNSGEVTISAYKMTGNGKVSNSNNSATLDAASEVSCYVPAAYTGEVTLTASANTGYVFMGWYNTSNGLISTDNPYTYNAPNEAKTIRARFKNETVHQVAVTYVCASPSTTVKPAESPHVGEITSSTFTAGTPKGFTFSSWTVGDGLTITSGSTSTNSISVKTKSSGTYSLRANYTENLSSTYVLKGAFDSWGSGVAMTKKTGHSTEDWVYCTRSFTGSESTTAIKIHDGSAWHGAADASNTLTKQTGSLTSTNWTLSSPGNDINFKHNWTGTYEFAYNTSTNILYVTYPEFNQLRISAASPADATNTGNYNLSAPSSSVRTVTRSLKANTTYTFKIVYLSDWYGNNSGAYTRSTSTSSGSKTLNTSGGNLTLTTDYAGDYTFKFNQSTKTLSIDFPEAYKIHFERGAINGGKVSSYPIATQVETSTSVTSDVTWVKAGNTVTLTAAQVKDGGHYIWYGWYTVQNPDRANPSTNRLGTSLAYTTPAITSASNKNFYAVYFETEYWVNTRVDGQGTISPAAGQNAYIETLSGNFTASPGTGYKFDNWTQSSGALTITSPNSTTTTVNATAASELQANFSPRWSVMVKKDGGEWCATNANLLTGYGEGTIGYADITLDANSNYEIKIYDRQTSTWYGGSVAQNIDYKHSGLETVYTIATTYTPYSVYLQSAAAGTYRFAWNLTGYKIAVQYPTSWYITSGQKTEGQDDNAGGSFTAEDNDSRDVTGGKFVANDASVTFRASPNTGYNFDGWYTNEACTEGRDATNPKTISSIRADQTVYAKFVPNTYTVTLTQTGAGSAGTPSVTASYNTTAPAIASLPTAPQGYAFMGYYTAADGEGSQLVAANGTWQNVAGYTSGGKWIRDGGAELFAYFKKAEITAITLNSSVLDPVAAGETGWVIANPTVEPTPVLPVKICWELLYDNDNPVPAGHEAEKYTEEDTKPNQVRFSIAGLAASRYKIKATLRTGSSCDGGDELSTHTQTFTIASSFTINILYQDDDGSTIAPGTTSPGKATDWTTISAPDIFGYTFAGWTLGEGITAGDPTDQQNDFRFKASYYGTIVAQYTKNQYIYLDLSQAFSASGKWNNPYVYFYNGDPWNNTNGAGASGHSNYISGHAMTKIDGTDIWYFDYGGVSGATRYVAFTWGNQTSQANFWKKDVIFRGDFSESTPLFVPATDGTAESRKTVVNEAQYYNKGYWVTYLGEATGYTLLVYNSAGEVELKREPFIAADKRMTMTSTVQLDASSNYKLEVLRNDGYYYNKAASNFTASSLGPKAIETGGSKYNIQTNADGIYTFTLGYSSGNLQLSVVYPSSIGDFRIAYTDNATWSHSHTLESWILPSKTIVHRANGVDIVSFFISKGDGITPKIRWQKVTGVSTSSVTWGTTVGTDCGAWLTTGYTDVSEAGVYNFKVTQNADGTDIASIERIGAYDGSYYIRCNALRSKWDHYTIDSDHRMTYSEFSESAANSFGEKYSHYKAKWCPRNTNIAFVIANDYSPCLTDKLTTDVGGPAFNNLEADGTLKYEKEGGNMKYNDASAYLDKYSANVRFMWNRKTNKISRAYVSAATSNNAKFLVLQGSGTANSNIYNGSTGDAFAVDPPGANSVILKDDQNWIYEEVIKANPSALVKLYANYCGQTQWFRGADGTPFRKDVNAIELLGGSASSAKYAVRVIYDFKTNRLVCAWMPEGASQEIETNLTVNADVMIVREHQGSAQCITFANDKSMTGVKTVYGAMKFNRWILSNRAHPEDTNPDHCRESNIGADLGKYHPVLPIDQQLSIYERSLYFISFPFNVKASEIFGFGHYWDEWYLEYYDGKTRAQKGYWIDSPANWKYVTPDMLEDFTLKANEGYILGLDLDFMKVDNTAFWSNGISTVELYFPSTVNLETLQQTDVTIPALSSDYKCTINRGTPEGDRRVKDSYWRCLGVPSFNIYNSALKDGSGKTIEWKTDYTWHADESEFPFIYMWNKADNTLTAQSTSAFNFLPMHAYLVQNGGEIKWTAVSAKPSSIVARKENDMPATTYEWRLTLDQDSNMVDQTFVRMTDLEQVTDSFDFGQDMSKEFNKTRSNLYSFIGYERAAANCLTLNTKSNTIIPLGLNIIAGGDYTLAMPDGTNGVGITLVDETTGTRTNLSAGLTYPVTLEKGDYTNRFFLEISPIKTTPTGIEDVQEGNVQSTKVHKVMIDGILYIVKDGKIFDARGARLR